MPQCCVPKCNYKKGGHIFPKDKQLCAKWVAVIRRDKWTVTKNSVVCRNHFKEEDYRKTNNYGGTSLKKVLKPEAVPSVFAWRKVEPAYVQDRKNRKEKRSSQRQQLSKRVKLEPGFDEPDLTLGTEEVILLATEQLKEDANFRPQCDVSTQTMTRQLVPRDISRYWNDDRAIHYFTGLENYKKFMFVLSTLGPAANELNYRWGLPCKIVSVENCFFLTLIKLRHNKCNFELSRDFDISTSMVSSIYVTWVNFMYCQWQEINWWPDQKTVRFYHPHNFNSPSTRVIYDGTEFPMQKPQNPVACQSSFSTYKNKNTLKVVVGSSPGGLITYISPAYGGSTSDRQIVEREFIHKNCDKGDTVMVDKGFNVQDLFAPHDVAVSIPTFLSGVSQLPSQSVIKDRKLSNKRVHIERIIGLSKTYKILSTILYHSEVPLGSRIAFVCATLCNFRKCIMANRV